jgi:hypothetical protein
MNLDNDDPNLEAIRGNQKQIGGDKNETGSLAAPRFALS